MTVKDEIRDLIDRLPEDEAKRLLEFLRSRVDPVARALREAPEDDEPTTPDEDVGADEAWNEYLRGEFLSADEAKRVYLR